MVIADGAVLEPIDSIDFSTSTPTQRRPSSFLEGTAWVEGDPAGPDAIYVRLPSDKDPNTAMMELSLRWMLFFPADAASDQKCEESSQRDHLLAGLTFRHGASGRQKMALCLREGSEALDNTMEWMRAGVVQLDGSSSFVGNTVRYGGIEGIGGTNIGGARIAYNNVYGHAWADPTGSGHGGCGKITRTHLAIVEHNRFAECYINGLWLDNRNSAIVVHANLFEGSDATGLHSEHLGKDVLVVNNVFYNTKIETYKNQNNVRQQGALKITDSNSHIVAGNTFVNNSNSGIRFNLTNRSFLHCSYDGDPACTGPGEHQQGNNLVADENGAARSRDHVVYNNAFASRFVPSYTNTVTGATEYPLWAEVYVGPSGPEEEASLRFGGNRYLDHSPEDRFRASLQSGQSRVEANEVSAWAAIIHDVGSSTFAAPLAAWSDTTAVGSLLLPPSSPLINGAISLPDGLDEIHPLVYTYATIDAWDRPRGVRPDVGAVEAQ